MRNEIVRVAVIGGSGLYNMPDLSDIVEVDLTTPFGPPSDTIMVGTLAGERVAFMARHGRGHIYLPSEVPYRANIHALKQLGVERIIAVSACGSLREDFVPGHIVVPDQLFDQTKGLRDMSFFGDGLGAHVSVDQPFCPQLRGMVNKSVVGAGGTSHDGGAFITIEGPRFSTKAESNVYRSWGMSIIGMTTSPEAFLAREAEMCYAVMAHVTDYDVWHESEETVTVDMVVKTLSSNVKLARSAIVHIVEQIASQDRSCQCGDALSDALITSPRSVSQKTLERLDIIVGKYYE